MSQEPKGTSMSRKKILIVDDDHLLTRTIDMGLRNRGYEVKVIYSAAAAVKSLIHEKPDLIVLDIRLPDCDGWFIPELLRELEMAEGIDVIVMSVLDPDSHMITLNKPYAFIQKPFDMGEFISLVEKSLETSRKK
ncbi:MAG: response regulator [Dehalococcoidia bacterium]|nr:response regulator [Dehalococcoidia bacterium]